MCRSLAEGGQRCASHTRPAYESALADYDHARSPSGTGTPAPAGGVSAATRLTDAAAHYASTPEGAVRVGAEAQSRIDGGDMDTGTLLNQAGQQGQRMRQASQDTAAIVRDTNLGSSGIRQAPPLIPRNYKVVANYPPAAAGHSHTTVRLEWQRTTATGQKAGVAICECGAEQRIMQYAKAVKRSRR